MRIRSIGVGLLAASCGWAQAQTQASQTAPEAKYSSASDSSAKPDAATDASAKVPIRGTQTKSAETKEAKARENEAKVKKVLALRLLKRSHGVNQELSVENRVDVLSEQVSVAARLDPKLANEWANELLELSSQMPDRSAAVWPQQRAIAAIATNDPDRALTLFRKVPAEVSANPMTGDVRTGLAAALFPAVLEKKGNTGLSLLQAEARRLGEDNAYPYMAMMDVGRAIVGLDKPDRWRDVSNDPLLGGLLDEATGYYQQSPASLAQDCSFAAMLEMNAGFVTAEKAKPALELVVNRLIKAQQDPIVKFHGGFTTANGQLDVDNIPDYTLVQLSHLIRELEPELMDKAAAERPSFGRLAQGLGPAGWVTSAWGGTSTLKEAASAPSSVPSWQEQSEAALRRSPKNWRFDPNRSVALAQSLTDPYAQAAVYSQVATWVAQSDPEKSDQLLQKSEKLIADSKDKQLELKVVTSRVEWASATNNATQLRESMRRGFELGNTVIRADQDEHPDNPTAWSQLWQLVRICVSKEPELTAGYLDNISVPVARARLLTVAAGELANLSEPPQRRSRPREVKSSK